MKSLRCLILSILLALSLISMATSNTITTTAAENNKNAMVEEEIPPSSHHQHRRYLRSVEYTAPAAEQQGYRDLSQQEEELMLNQQHLDMVDEKLDDHRGLYDRGYYGPRWRRRYPYWRRRHWYRHHRRYPYWDW